MITSHLEMLMISLDNSLVAEIPSQISWTMMMISLVEDSAVLCSSRWIWEWAAAKCSSNRKRDDRLILLEWEDLALAATSVLHSTMTMISAALAVWVAFNRSSQVHLVEWEEALPALLKLRPSLRMENKWQELKRLQLINMATKPLKWPRKLMTAMAIVPARPIWLKEMLDNSRDSKLSKVVQRQQPKTKSQNPAISTSDSRLSIEFS